MRLLALGAHPDDIEFGCAGALIKYAQKGENIYLVVLTKGDLGGDPEVRMREQIKSQRIIGAQKLYWGDYEDTKIPLDKKLIQWIENIIEEVKPDFIFVNYPEDTHQDHRRLASASISATRYTRNVLFYEVPTTNDFNPNVFVDIKPVFRRKINTLEAHRSQLLKTNIEDLSIVDIAEATAHFRGTQARVKYAEGFVSLRLFINI